MEQPTFKVDAFCQRIGAQPTKVEYLVRAGILRPAEVASRRGVSRKYNLRNLAEAMVGIELIEAGILADDVREAVSTMTDEENWPRLCDPTRRDDVSLLVVQRLSGMTRAPVSIHLSPAKDVGEICDTGYTILAAVSVGYILRMIEREFPGASLA